MEEKTRKVLYVCDEKYLQYCDRFPKVPQRASLTHHLIAAYGLTSHMTVVPAKQASDQDVQKFHTEQYVECLKQSSSSGDHEKHQSDAEEFGLIHDCPTFRGVYEASTLIAGASIQAAEALITGEYQVAINWCGGWHHCKRDGAEGFCYINDIVLAILKLREHYNKVLYIDLDLHHGNGVEDAFCATSKVMTVSLHGYAPGFYPGTGDVNDVGFGKAKGYTVNAPLKEGASDETFIYMFDEVMPMVQESFKADAVVCQCGVDALAGDPMSTFNLTPAAYEHCIKQVMSWKLPTVLLGGGGYNIPNAARCWTRVTGAVVGQQLATDIPEHGYFLRYGPHFSLDITASNRVDTNTDQHLYDTLDVIQDNLQYYIHDTPAKPASATAQSNNNEEKS